MKVAEYLAKIRRMVITCRPEDTLETAATLLASHQIGAMPVRNEDGRVVGMLSERDIVRAFSLRGKAVGGLKVEDLMRTRFATCAPEDTMQDARKLMKAEKVRHVPVLRGEILIGLLSISDALEAILQETDLEVHVLRDHALAMRGL